MVGRLYAVGGMVKRFSFRRAGSRRPFMYSTVRRFIGAALDGLTTGLVRLGSAPGAVITWFEYSGACL
jgi:hypothetical protein